MPGGGPLPFGIILNGTPSIRGLFEGEGAWSPADGVRGLCPFMSISEGSLGIRIIWLFRIATSCA